MSHESAFIRFVSTLRFFLSVQSFLYSERLKLSIDIPIDRRHCIRHLWPLRHFIFEQTNMREIKRKTNTYQTTSPKGWAPTMGLQKWEFSVLPSWFIQLNKYNWNYFKNKLKSSKVDVATDTHTIHVRVTCEQKRGKPIIKWNNRQFEWKYWKYTRSKAVFNRKFLSKLMGLTVISA